MRGVAGVAAVSLDLDGIGNAGLQTGTVPRTGASVPAVSLDLDGTVLRSAANVLAVSFDVDGTLYSDRFLGARVLLEAVRQRAPRDLHRLATRRSPSRSLPERLDAEARLLIPIIRRLGPQPGVVEFLDNLRPRTLIVVSDFAPEAKLEALGLKFDRVYAAERYGALKPDPRVFRAALNDLEIPPGSLLHIGNRPETDGAAAKAAGCPSLILGHDFPSFCALMDGAWRRTQTP